MIYKFDPICWYHEVYAWLTRKHIIYVANINSISYPTARIQFVRKLSLEFIIYHYHRTGTIYYDTGTSSNPSQIWFMKDKLLYRESEDRKQNDARAVRAKEHKNLSSLYDL